MNRRFGYCCINLSLEKKKVSTNRGMVKKTFLEKGIGYASQLALLNVRDLRKVLEWNADNQIRMYRMSSDIFPWCSEYELVDLPDFEEIAIELKMCGDLAKTTDQRLTFHPSPYCVIASERSDVVQKSFKELRQHAEIMDLMGLERTNQYPINIHINTTKPTKEHAANRFCESYNLLPQCVKKRLVVEVDDKKSQFTSVDLYNMVHLKIGIPVTFDYLHNQCNPPELNEEDSLKLCLSTWPEGIIPLTHYSDSRRLFEDSSSKEVAHSDWIWKGPETYGLKFSIELEVKMKEKALLKYRDSLMVSL
jgi:UV DNA damage endonuclease